jgi:ParB/RepB/Spo0J family partition protein
MMSNKKLPKEIPETPKTPKTPEIEIESKEERHPQEYLPLRIERKLIRHNRFNPRTKPDRENVSDILPSITTDGIHDSLLIRPVTPDEEGCLYEVVDGDRRLTVAEMLKIAYVDVLIKSMTDMQALKEGTIFNSFRRNIGAVELGRAYLAIKESDEYKFMTLTQFAHRMGRSKGDMSRLMSLPEGLRPDLQDIVAPTGIKHTPEGSIDERTAYYLTRLPKDERQAEAAEAFMTLELKGDPVGRAVDQMIRQPEIPAKVIAEKVKEEEVKTRQLTISISLEDYEKIRQGKKTTIIVPKVPPGMKADIEIVPVIRGQAFKVMDVFERSIGRLKDTDAKRDGYDNLEELKDAWIRNHGDWTEEEVISVIQFYKKDQLVEAVEDKSKET